ncbi:MAG TPA: sulfotransferase [Acidimicrobiales bacterium]|nr:sulfotransferase [Acidimicrobiales bacterium]
MGMAPPSPSADRGSAAPEVSGLRRTIGREAAFLRRAVRKPSLWRRRLRRTLSPKVAFVDRQGDPGRSLLVVGSARSGTTWLAELLTEALHCRFIFEPLHNDYVPAARPVLFGQYLDPQPGVVADPAVADVLDRVLTGRLRSRWSDEYNTVRLPRSRLIKEIRATNLLPWLAIRYPRTPIVYILRHPVPSAWSVTELGWPDRLEQFLSQDALRRGPLAPFATLIAEAENSPDPFSRFVLRWCLENAVPTSLLDPARVCVVFYEHLVTDPGRELRRLSEYLGTFTPGPWEMHPGVPAGLDRPSHTNYRDTPVASGAARLGDWLDAVAPSQVDAAMALVRGFGLDRLYGRSTEPLVAPDAVLRGPPPGPSHP